MTAESQIRLLPVKFEGKGEVKGYTFTQLVVGERGFIYEVSSDDTEPHYEVFRRKIVAPHPKSKDQRYKESYPRSKAFGVWAWTYMSLDKAEEKLMQL